MAEIKKTLIGNVKGPEGEPGAKGEPGETGATGQRGSGWTQGMAITGTDTEGTVFPESGISDAVVNDNYLNTITGNTYRCILGGDTETAEWVYTGNLKGPEGDGANIKVDEELSETSENPVQNRVITEKIIELENNAIVKELTDEYIKEHTTIEDFISGLEYNTAYVYASGKIGGNPTYPWNILKSMGAANNLGGILQISVSDDGRYIYFTHQDAKKLYIRYYSVSGESFASDWVDLTTADKLATARNIAISGDITGNISPKFDGSADGVIDVKRRGCIVGNAGKIVSEKLWYKFASLTHSNANWDSQITFKVTATYSDLSTQLGILTAHIRTNSSGVIQSFELVWEYALSGIDTRNFIIAYNSANPIIAELYVYCDADYRLYRFDVITEGTRQIRSTNEWAVNDNQNTTGGLTAEQVLEGRTTKASTLATLENNISGSASKFSEKSLVSFLGSGTGYIYSGQNGGNLDDYKSEYHGFVYNMTNSPASYGFLDVSWFNGAGFVPSTAGVCRQVFTDYSTGRMYTRIWKSSAWSAWVSLSSANKVATEVGTSNVSRRVYFANTNGTDTEASFVWDDDFKYNPYTNTLDVGSINVGVGAKISTGTSASNFVTNILNHTLVATNSYVDAGIAFQTVASGVSFYATGLNIKNLGTSTNKWSAIYASTSTITTSDAKEKENIVLIDMELAENLADKLEPVTYILKDGESGRTHYGMIAQQIEEVMQELGIDSRNFAAFIKAPVMEDIYGDAVDEEGNVILDEDGNPKKVIVSQRETGEYTYMLRYEELYAILWRAFQAKSKKIQVLEETVQKQQTKISELQEKVNSMEGRLSALEAMFKQ